MSCENETKCFLDVFIGCYEMCCDDLSFGTENDDDNSQHLLNMFHTAKEWVNNQDGKLHKRSISKPHYCPTFSDISPLRYFASTTDKYTYVMLPKLNNKNLNKGT